MKNKASLLSVSVFILCLVASGAAFAASEGMVIEPTVSVTGNSLVPQGLIPVNQTEGGHLISVPGVPFSIGDVEGLQLPYIVETPKLIRYPRWAQRKGWEGRFTLAVEVLSDGTVGRTLVMESTGYPVLDEASTEAIRTWKFRPAQKEGQPVVECVQIPVTFELQK